MNYAIMPVLYFTGMDKVLLRLTVKLVETR
jgi:hypothetical protein